MFSIAYDIRTFDTKYQKELETSYSVKMTAEDEAFYQDNCKGAYIATCKATVSAEWLKSEKRRMQRQDSDDRKRETMTKMKEEENTVKMEFYEECASEENASDMDAPVGDEFIPSSRVNENPLNSNDSKRSTRSQDDSIKSPIASSDNVSTSFPDVPVRSGKKRINEALMRCLVQCLSDYKVSRNDLCGIVVSVANLVFHQRWERHSELEGNDGNDQDDESEFDTDEETTEPSGATKRRRAAKDLTHVFPSNRCLDMYLEDASFLNLKMVADKIINKEDGDVVTVGYDDFTKAAGYGTISGKADHITICGPDKRRKTLTTGFIENLGHSGAEGAEGYEYKLKCLAFLGGCTVMI